MSTQQRIRVYSDAPTGIKILHDVTGEVLGEFVPGLGYWITDVNRGSVENMLHNAFAKYEDPADAPTLPTDLRSAEGQITGFLSVGD